MKTAGHILEAAKMTARTGPEAYEPFMYESPAARFMCNLQVVREGVSQPCEPGVVDNLAYVLLNPQAPAEDRRECANRALETTALGVLKRVPSWRSADWSQARSRAVQLSDTMVTGMLEVASRYPDRTDTAELRSAFVQMLRPPENATDRLVSALALADVARPYLAQRILALNVYDGAAFKQQVAELRSDTALLRRFAPSTAHSMEFATTGATEATPAEVADELFDIGPIFAQGAQLFTTAARAAKDGQQATFMYEVGRAMQEGVTMPTPQRLRQLADNLPAGLTLNGILSSAKIAYVVKTQDQDGQTYATKIRRPGIEQALADNVRIFTLLSEVVQAYVQDHASDTAFANRLTAGSHTLPLLLQALKTEVQGEIDFAREAGTQQLAAAQYAGHAGIRIARVYGQFSDSQHITMDLLPGTRIEDAPANQAHINNVMTLLLQAWKGRVLSGRKVRLLHGDMHEANIKADADGSDAIVAYDWGKSVELPPGFSLHMGRFLAACARKNPAAIGKAYCRIQDAGYTQLDGTQATQAAQQTLAQIDRRSAAPATNDRLQRLKTLPKDATSVLTAFLARAGGEHHSLLDVRYMTALRSAMAVSTVLKSELGKAAYQRRFGQSIAIGKGVLAAIKAVYFTKATH